jgi:acetaldehyde dehydrogenase/alcohol dehydrogenase
MRHLTNIPSHSAGVGPGNAPAIIDELADLPTAVASIILSKTFDNGG